MIQEKTMSDKRPTPDQQAIIDCKTDNILVPAAAGSGKTTVMIDRIVSKIIGDMSDDSIPEHEKHSLDSILVVTFIVKYSRTAFPYLKSKASVICTYSFPVALINFSLKCIYRAYKCSCRLLK